MSDNINARELFEDQESIDEFNALLAEAGLVIHTTDAGLVIGMTHDKLIEFTNLANEDVDKKVIIYIKRQDLEEDNPDQFLN